MIRVLVVAGVAVAAGAAAVWRWCTSESRPATDPGPASASRYELGRPRPAQEIEGNQVTERASEQQVTDFMIAHLQVALKTMDAATQVIEREESRLIEKYQPALNIEGSDDDNAMVLLRLRRILRASVPELFRGESA